ncbi:SigE family RNA polymerase sigma factor [Actinospica robiniae]|uniref:SigE family RNA polymerase sigma factor n=1 Tax=Actinospica robiniae TaxID=304901 RepID=UPI0007C5687D|nr:SigE family RNA polymerase sigma factor [Actinospica robiniae]
MAAGLDFDEFYHGTFHRVVGQVFAMTGSLTEAEDSVQEAYARAWQNWSKISQYEDMETWVRGVAFRVSVSNWRKTVNRFSAHKRGAKPDGDAGLSPDRLAIIIALRQIPADQRQVIVLFHFLDRSVEEISREIGVPAGTVKSRLARGRKALAPHLSEFAETAIAAATSRTASTSAPAVSRKTDPKRTSRKEGAPHV